MEMPRLIEIQNGDRAPGTFSDAEMKRRLSSLRKLMAERSMDAALFTSYHNINYYSDFLYCAFGRPYGLVVTQDAATSISANIDGGQPWRRTHGENVVFTDWQRDNFFSAVKKLIPNDGVVGIEHDHINLQNYAKVQAVLPSASLVDIAAHCMYLRMVKSDEEIALITEGARIADVGGAACVEAIAVGVPEIEVHFIPASR